jgi:hypothetical protein
MNAESLLLVAPAGGWARGVLIGLPVACILAWSVGKLIRRGSGLKKHYLRLGQIAPDEPCPCGQGKKYMFCCRPRDVERLERDVVSYLTARWSRGSYKGRRSISSMKNRIQENPLPVVVLPGWVSDPDLYDFPIAEDVLREWTPVRRKRRSQGKPRGRRR